MEDFNVIRFKSTNDKEMDLVFAKYMIEAANICTGRTWRASATVTCDMDILYEYDFSNSHDITGDDMVRASNDGLSDKLRCRFFEVCLDENGKPIAKEKWFHVLFYCNGDNGERALALENSMYRAFAAYVKKAIEHFDSRLIFDVCYIKDEPYRL